MYTHKRRLTFDNVFLAFLAIATLIIGYIVLFRADLIIGPMLNDLTSYKYGYEAGEGVIRLSNDVLPMYPVQLSDYNLQDAVNVQ